MLFSSTSSGCRSESETDFACGVEYRFVLGAICGSRIGLYLISNGLFLKPSAASVFHHIHRRLSTTLKGPSKGGCRGAFHPGVMTHEQDFKNK